MKTLTLLTLFSVTLVAIDGCNNDPSGRPLTSEELRNEKNPFLKALESTPSADRQRYLSQHRDDITQLVKSKDFDSLRRIERVMKSP